jgi:hypothetical protein
LLVLFELVPLAGGLGVEGAGGAAELLLVLVLLLSGLGLGVLGLGLVVMLGLVAPGGGAAAGASGAGWGSLSLSLRGGGWVVWLVRSGLVRGVFEAGVCWVGVEVLRWRLGVATARGKAVCACRGVG